MNIDSNARLESFDTQKIVEFLGKPFRMEDFYFRRSQSNQTMAFSAVEDNPVVTGIDSFYLSAVAGGMDFDMPTFWADFAVIAVNETTIAGNLEFIFPSNIALFGDGLTASLQAYSLGLKQDTWPEIGLAAGVNLWRFFLLPNGTTVQTSGGVADWQIVSTSTVKLIYSVGDENQMTPSGTANSFTVWDGSYYFGSAGSVPAYSGVKYFFCYDDYSVSMKFFDPSGIFNPIPYIMPTLYSTLTFKEFIAPPNTFNFSLRYHNEHYGKRLVPMYAGTVPAVNIISQSL